MEKMLINATPEEVRVALVHDNYLYDLDVEKPSAVKKKANIYKGRITRLEPSLEAAFVEYGSKRQGFLPLKEISSEYYIKQPENEDEKPNIKDLLKEGQELMIQIDKEERGTKGAALTTYITLAGCYLVLMPNNPKSGGISRRIDGDDREQLKNIMNSLNVPEHMGMIVRTAGVGKDLEELQWDLEFLINQWSAIQAAFDKQPAPFLIHQEGDVILRSIRDNLRKSIDEIIIDDQPSYVKARQYIEQVKPDFVSHLKLYNDTIPLFTRHQIESQIETAYQRQVGLPAGGSLVIDRTEALVSIDINSAKATGGSDIEQTALNTNLEAADEIARQLRLRDLGGLIVIDFIDMYSSKNQREVESRLRAALKTDRARIQVGRISRFGLLEMSRQRIRLSLGESNQEPCPRCDGRGVIRSFHSHALSLMRLIEEEAIKEGSFEIQLQLPIEIATFILNEKREVLIQIQKRHGVNIVILPNPHLQTPNYQFTRIKSDSKRNQASYKLIEEPEIKVIQVEKDSQQKQAEPAIKLSAQLSGAKRQRPEQVGIVKRLWNALFGGDTSSQTSNDDKNNNVTPLRQHRKRGSGGGNKQNKGRQSQNRQNNKRRHHNSQRNRQSGDKNKKQQRNKRPQHNKANSD